MNKVYVFPAIFLLLLCCGCRKAGRQTEIMRHHEHLLHALVAGDSAALRHEQCYVADSLAADTLLASPHLNEYLCAWADSYGSSPADSLAVERFSEDVKRLAVRLLDERREKSLEEMLRIVARRLLEQGMDNVAAVTAAAAVGVDADPHRPGDIAKRLLTRLLLLGADAPRLSTGHLPAPGVATLLLFYETTCPECEEVLQSLSQSYASLTERGVQVVSIASDYDGQVFLARAATLPWSAKWQAPYGFYSDDFEAYGIAATPTLVSISKEGKVTGFTAKLEEEP